MSNYDRWLEQPYQDKYDEEDAIDQEVEALLADEYDIKKFDVFMDAIANDALYAEEHQKAITKALQTGDRLALGQAIFDAVAVMLDSWANDHAVDRYNQGLC